ncbi:Lysophospholipase-like protein 1 [Myotis brandtii]|uniref:palmitoyl-protein hydrolase n=1 Tax=Myotis brandtii TaxID=109478 RepID=S7NFJ0_MYOBR|nr:Lysophospholipase-like protein 1 [Myotis brandtii]
MCGASSGYERQLPAPIAPQEEEKVEKPSEAIGTDSRHSHPLLALSHQDGARHRQRVQVSAPAPAVGGFSMGGCMAMHVAYRNHQDVAGVFALSSFLNKTSAVYQALQKRDGALPELFQCHGTADELVLHSWGEETNSALQSLGVSTKFHSFPGLFHELSTGELEKLKAWILAKLPGEMERQKE